MADSLKGRLLYVCATPQPSDLLVGAYQALTWVQVKHIGSLGETGTKDNILSYDELDTDVMQKGKGIANAGDPAIEIARVPTDPGQIILRAAGLLHQVYAFKVTDGDAVAGFTPTTSFFRGLVGGPAKPNGRQENFNLEVYTIGIVQREIVVDPAALSVPVNLLAPAIHSPDSVPDVSNATLLTAGVGLWSNLPTSYTYQWQRDAAGNGTFVNIGAATNQTYNVQAGDLNNCLRCQVTAVNSAGSSAVANTMATKATQA